MNRVLCAALAAAALAACGPTNTPVTLGGVTLQPRSSLMYNVVAPGMSATVVYVVDQPDICAQVTAQAQTSCQSSSSNPFSQGTLLMVGAGGIEPKAYPVNPNTGGSAMFSGGFLMFGSLASGSLSSGDTAVSGTVWLDNVKLNDVASGHYDVTMQSGAALKGSFVGSYCPGFDLLSSVTGKSCSVSGAGTSCTGTCSCKGKVAMVQCTASGTTWTCDCTSSTGARSTCTKTASSTSAACGETTSCCPMTF